MGLSRSSLAHLSRSCDLLSPHVLSLSRADQPGDEASEPVGPQPSRSHDEREEEERGELRFEGGSGLGSRHHRNPCASERKRYRAL